jgi:predicted flap endonuclease-1-like 5' DNA nuclease
MTTINEFINQLPEFAGVFMLMLSTFLIGYFSGWWLQKTKSRALIARLKREVNTSLSQQKKINDIETIFTEIKPKIIQVVKEAQDEIKVPQTPQNITERARTSYVSYTKNKPTLDFEAFGYGNKRHPDDLTQIGGIGPYIEQKLNEIGIYNYDQISRFRESDIRIVTELIDFFPGRIERDNWVGQAQALKTH